MVYLLLTAAGAFLGVTVVSVYGIERTLVRRPERRGVDRRQYPEARRRERRRSFGPYDGPEQRRGDRRFLDRRVTDRRATVLIEREAA